MPDSVPGHPVPDQPVYPPDCWATYHELSAKGVEFTEPPEERFYGIDAAFRDPSGNAWRLTQPTELEQVRASFEEPTVPGRPGTPA